MNNLSKYAFLGGQSVATKSPELDVFDATADEDIVLEWMELYIKYLRQANTCI